MVKRMQAFTGLAGALMLVLPLPLRTFAEAPVPWDIKGMMFNAYWIGKYTTPEAGRALDRIAALGVNHIGLVQWWWQETAGSSTIAPDKGKSTPEAELREVIAMARKRGLKVSLTLGVGVQRGGEENPENPEAWFASFRKFAVTHARIAQEEDLDIFFFGGELDELSGVKEHRKRFAEVIRAVRHVFKGTLSYKANWYNYPEVTFWDLVDVCSIDAYFRLHPGASPTKKELLAAWRRSNVPSEKWWNGRDWVADVIAWQKTVGKPVLFGEVGYPSRQYGASKPWLGGKPYDPGVQVRGLEAMFETWRDPGPWFRGGFLWEWPADPHHGGPGDTKLFLNGKPAAETVRKWYGGAPEVSR